MGAFSNSCFDGMSSIITTFCCQSVNHQRIILRPMVLVKKDPGKNDIDLGYPITKAAATVVRL